MLITKEITIEMGHSVTNHSSKCRGLHGHTYRIIATAYGDLISEDGSSSEGMVIDFGQLKQSMLDVIDANFDHGFVIWEKDPRVELLKQANDLHCYQRERFHVVDFVPTAENLAKYWFLRLRDNLFKYHVQLKRLEVFETPTSSAIYEDVIVFS